MGFFCRNSHKPNKTLSCRLRESGNVFLMLFGAVGMVGIIGASTMTVMKGPVKTMSEVTKRTLTENQIIAAGKLALIAATQTNGGDCDADDTVEPVEMSASTIASFTGGSEIPNTIGVGKEDSWGMPFGYCAWDHGTASCGGNRLAGKVTTIPGQSVSEYVIAIVSAGPDGVFNTTCNTFVDGDSNGDADIPLLQTAANSDDIVLGYTYDEAAAASGGLWNLDSSDPNTAEIAKNIKIRDSDGDEAFAFDAGNQLLTVGDGSTGTGQFPVTQTDILRSYNGAGNTVSIQSTLSSDSAITTSGDVTTTGTGNITSAGTLAASGLATLSGGINAVSADIDTTGDVGTGTLTASSVVSGGSLTTTGTLNAGTSTLGATTVDSLDASAGLIQTNGDAAFGDELTDTVTIGGITTIGATLDVTGDTSVSTLDTSGLAQLESLAVTNTTTLNGLTNLNGNTVLGDAGTDTLTVNALINSNLTMGGTNITGLANPTPADLSYAATVQYVNSQIAAGVPAAEQDPEVGDLGTGTAGMNWCTSNGSEISCTAATPSEDDPQVGTLTAGQWCTTDGTDIDCTSDAPSGLPTGCSSGQVAQYNGATWVCANASGGGGSGSGGGSGGTTQGFVATGTPTLSTTLSQLANFTEDKDEGDVFDASTGVFTAPADGFYQFNLNIWVSSTSSGAVDAIITAAGKDICRNFEGVTPTGNYFHGCSGAHYMTAGQTAYTRGRNSNGSTASTAVFSGVLIGGGGGSGSGGGWIPDGTVAYSGSVTTGWTDVDLSSVVGAQEAMVLLKLDGGSNIAVRPKGETLDSRMTTSNLGGGAASGFGEAGKALYLISHTDSTGTIQIRSIADGSLDIYVEGYIPTGGSGGSGSADNLGDHTATQDLNMASNDIININKAEFDELAGDPPVFSSDTLGGLVCTDGQVAAWNATGTLWECSDGPTGADNLGDHTATQDIDVASNDVININMLEFDSVVGDPPASASGTLSGLSCNDGEVAVWNAGGSVWECGAGGGADNLGDHTATTNLDMATNEINDAGKVNFTSLAGDAPIESSDTLGGLSCADGEVAVWNATGTVWECGAGGGGGLWTDSTNGYLEHSIVDTGIKVGNVNGMAAPLSLPTGTVAWGSIASIPAGFADGTDDGITVESDPTVPANIKDGIAWSEVSGIPAGFADGTDDGITSETDPKVGTLTNTKWCTTDGSVINCTTDAPTGGDNLGNHTATTTLNLSTNDITNAGDVTATAYYHSSDERLKDNIKTTSGLELISQLRGVTYDWKENDQPSAGVIAQEVEAVFPRAVKTDANGMKSVEYDQLIGPLIEAVKELKAKNEALESRIIELESK